MTEILDIVNENDEIIGQVERDDSKKSEHIVRTVFIGFYTSDKRIILQLRSMAKQNNPGKLTTTVSGHVISGSTYDETAIKEAREETGIEIDPSLLKSVGVLYDGIAMRAIYVYPYDGDIAKLKVEENEGAGFASMSLDQLQKQIVKSPHKFVPFILRDGGTKLINYIEKI